MFNLWKRNIIKEKVYKILKRAQIMQISEIFPNINKVIRNSVVVGLIAMVSGFHQTETITAQTFLSLGIGFVLAFAVEFANAYNKNKTPAKKKGRINTFFL